MSHQLRSAWEEVEFRFDIYTVANVACVEHLQESVMGSHTLLKLFHVCIYKCFGNILPYYNPNHI
jgi:hypothetical protein